MSRIFAPFIAPALPIMILFGWLAPNPADLSALSLQRHEVSILVGVGASGTDCSGRYCQNVPSDRSYIVIPRAFRDAAIISLVRTTPVFAARSTSRAALLVVIMWVACAYWVRRNCWPPAALTFSIVHGVDRFEIYASDSQGLITSTFKSEKCRTFLVANLARRAITIPAI